MARKPKLPEELKKKEPIVPRYEDFNSCKLDFYEKVTRFCEEEDYGCVNTNTSVWIENNIIRPLEYFTDRKRKGIEYTAEDIYNAIDVVENITKMLNAKVRYAPTLFTICRILSISSHTFGNWTYENTDRGEAARIAQDYCRNLLTQTMYTGELHPAAGAFIGKATLGMREFDGSTTNINIVSTEKSVSEIMQELEQARKDLH